MRTRYFHDACGKHLFTRLGPPYLTGDLITTEDVEFPGGRQPQPGEGLVCNCGNPIAFGGRSLRHDRD